MDEKTRQLRRRNKELAKQKSIFTNLSEFEARGMGRRNKRHETFPLRQCDHIEGGTKITFRKKRTSFPYDMYLVTIIKGGHRCPKSAPYGKKCPEHTEAKAQENN